MRKNCDYCTDHHAPMYEAHNQLGDRWTYCPECDRKVRIWPYDRLPSHEYTFTVTLRSCGEQPAEELRQAVENAVESMASGFPLGMEPYASIHGRIAVALAKVEPLP